MRKRIKKIWHELKRAFYWGIFFTISFGCGGPAFSSAELLADSPETGPDAHPGTLVPDATIPETGVPDAMPEASIPDATPETSVPDSAPETGPRDRGRPPCVEGSPCFIRSGAWVCCGGTSSCPQPAEAELFCCIRNVECK